MKTKLAAILVLLLAPQLASAQADNQESRLELRGSAGWIGFSDDGTINHMLAGVSMRVALVKGLGVEPELTYMKGPGEDRDVLLTPVISYEFGKGRVRPYALGAVGMLWHRDTLSWSSATHASAGFGVRTQINDRWSVSPEFRMGMLPVHMQFKVGVGYRF